jgi:DNA-binding transcriptional ArsR family regulator
MDLLPHIYESTSGAGFVVPEGTMNGTTVETSLLGWEALGEAAKCLKSVAHPVRLRLLELLLEGEYTVGELADICETDQPTVSGHLSRLRDRGILAKERRGRRVYYRVAAMAVSGIVQCMRKNFGAEGGRAGERCGH